MVSTTRGDRKRRSSSTEDEPEEDGTQFFDPLEAEAVLEQAETLRCSRNKKKKRESWERSHPPLEIVHAEIITHIMTYLDDSRDVYNFANCAKFIRDAVTAEVVVRSAVFAGGKPREAITSVMALVQAKSIRTPSAFRLFRLVNGRRCERLGSCYGYNLETKMSEDMSKIGKRPYGLCICQVCTCPLSSNAYHYSSTFTRSKEADVLAKTDWTKLLCQQQFEASTGDAVGPFVLCEKVKQIQNTYASDEDKLDALAKIHEDLSKDSPEPEEFRLELVDVFLQAQTEYDTFVRAKQQLVFDKEDAKRNARASKKKENVDAVLKEVRRALKGYRHRDRVLDGWSTPDGFYHLTKGPSRAILGPLLSAPSNASQRRIQAACKDVKEVYDLLESHSFISVGDSFLKKFPRRGGPTLLALYNYCFKYSCRSGLLAKGRTRSGYGPWFDYGPFVSSLREGKLADALFFAMDQEERTIAFKDYVTRQERVLFLCGKCRKLAEVIWRDASHTITTYESYQLYFQTCKQEYNVLSQSFKDYLHDPRTVAFLAETTATQNNGNLTFSRQHAIDTVLKLNHSQKNLLRNRLFSQLLARHRSFFNAGRDLTYPQWMM